jgi:hypothetical protein
MPISSFMISALVVNKKELERLRLEGRGGEGSGEGYAPPQKILNFVIIYIKGAF